MSEQDAKKSQSYIEEKSYIYFLIRDHHQEENVSPVVLIWIIIYFFNSSPD